jgi:hypothetical protein
VRVGVVLCAVIGHRWHVDESTEIEPVLCCDRCGRTQLAPTGSAFGNRVNVKAGADRAVGPFGGRR